MDEKVQALSKDVLKMLDVQIRHQAGEFLGFDGGLDVAVDLLSIVGVSCIINMEFSL